MTPYYSDEYATIYHGDCREVLPGLDGFTACVTDPPYGLEFMGKDWDKGVPGEEFWRIVAAACLPGAPLLSFGGTRTYHRLACAIEDAGWEVRDCLMWLYGSGFPKSLDVGKAIDKAAGAEREVVGTAMRSDKRGGNFHGASEQRPAIEVNLTTPATDAAKLWDGWGTALKPAYEPILLAMNPLDGTFAQNAQRRGVAGLNVDGGRIATNGESIHAPQSDPAKRSGTVGRDLGISNASRDTFQQAQRESAERTATLGRWPANVIHDGSAEVVEGFPVTGKSSVSMRGLSGRHDAGDQGNQRLKPDTNSLRGHNDNGGAAARFFYCAKASSAERRGTADANNHPTVKPQALMRYLLTLVTMPTCNRIVDPFMGSGSTLVAAKALNLPCVGIDLDESHCATAAKRLAQGVLPLWNDPA